MPLDVILLLDVQDDFHPAEVGSDDVIMDFAKAFTEQGLVANFLFFAERSLLLKERNRSDVIRSLEPHAVGIHGPGHKHPSPPEYAATQSWPVAVEEVAQREFEAADIIRDVFGRDPCALSQHGNNTSPHVLAVAGRMGIPYIYNYPAAPPKYSITWFAGGMNIPWCPDPGYYPPVPWFEMGDDAWSDNSLFDEAMTRLDQSIARAEQEEQKLMPLYISHPYRVRSVQSVEYWQSVNGVNIPDRLWGKNGGPQLRTPEQMAVARANMRRMAERLAGLSSLNIVGIPEIAEKYGYQPRQIERVQLRKAAENLCEYRSELAPGIPEGFTRAQVRREPDIPVDGPFSPAETMMGLAQSLLTYLRGEGLPDQVRRSEIQGPMDNSIMVPERRELDHDGLLTYVGEFVECAQGCGYLPTNVGPLGARIGIGSLYRAMADVYLSADRAQPIDCVLLPRYVKYPSAGRILGHMYADIAEFDRVDPNLNTHNLSKYGKLQSWTMKPAWDLAVQ